MSKLVGDGVTDNTAVLQAKLVRGQKTYSPPDGVFKFTGTLTVPPDTELVLGPNTQLLCAVTDGSDGIRVGQGSIIRGTIPQSGLTSSQGSNIQLAPGAHVNAIVANCTVPNDAGIHLRNLTVMGNNAATATSCVRLDTVTALGDMRDCLIYGTSGTQNGLRIEASAGGCSEVPIEHCWFFTAAQSAVVVNAYYSIADLWFNRCLFEHCGDGHAGLELIATPDDYSTGAIQNVSVRDCHFERPGLPRTQDTYAIKASGIKGLRVDNTTLGLTNNAHDIGIHFAADHTTQGAYITNVSTLGQSSAELSTTLRDLSRTPAVIDVGKRWVDSYIQGDYGGTEPPTQHYVRT